MFHICRTIRRHFSLRQVKLCIGQWKYKQKFTTQGRKDRPSDRPTSEWIRAPSLNSYFTFCRTIVVWHGICNNLRQVFKLSHWSENTNKSLRSIGLRIWKPTKMDRPIDQASESRARSLNSPFCRATYRSYSKGRWLSVSKGMVKILGLMGLKD